MAQYETNVVLAKDGLEAVQIAARRERKACEGFLAAKERRLPTFEKSQRITRFLFLTLARAALLYR